MNQRIQIKHCSEWCLLNVILAVCVIASVSGVLRTSRENDGMLTL